MERWGSRGGLEVGTVTKVVFTNYGITAQRDEETCNFTTDLMNE